MTKLEATHQPNFSELEKWHYEEKRGADTDISFGNWDQARKKLVLGKTDEITAVVYRYLKRLTVLQHRILINQDAFLSQRTPDGQTIWVQIKEFMETFRGTVGEEESLNSITRFKIEVLEQCIQKDIPPNDEYIQKDVTLDNEYFVGDDEEEPFMKGLSAAMADLRRAEDLQRNGKMEELENFCISDYQE
ncbi:hypothetical protein N0V85_001818 [Neurospora sp. IMI 360204]|nr:hypothetical protein N0V85_001818 [Neurospora sp. IMI 360204]